MANDGSDSDSNNDAPVPEEPKKLSAAWAIELDTELRCDRPGKDMCEYGKCWKEVDAATGIVSHHPISPRDSAFWLLHLVRRNTLLAKPPLTNHLDYGEMDQCYRAAGCRRQQDQVGGSEEERGGGRKGCERFSKPVGKPR